MKFLMLRGQVPQDRNPEEIIFDSIEKNDDVWSQLLYAMLNENDYGEIWYYNGPHREHKLAPNLTERWISNFETYKTNFVPNIVFARGAFAEYNYVLYKFSKAISIAYGAGRRFLLQPGFYDYDIILQDSPEQVEICKVQFPKSLTTLFIKPAADNIFYPVDCEKEFDICFPANATQPFKGHDFVYSTVPDHIKLLNLGNKPDRYKHGNNVTAFRVLRTEMAKHISRCEVGIVAVSSAVDSCPRVIPELLACDIPIVVLNDIRFWQSKYIVSGVTGELAVKDNFWDKVRHVLDNLDTYTPRQYYKENLSLEHAGKFIRGKIDEVKQA